MIGEVVDLFCGIGGLSYGFKRQGFLISGGIDVDISCKFAFESNNASKLHLADVAKISPSHVLSLFKSNLPRVLTGCAPCQPFSTYKYRYSEDPRWNLVGKFADIAAYCQTDFVTMENVPTLLKFQEGKVFEYFKNTLESAGYTVRMGF